MANNQNALTEIVERVDYLTEKETKNQENNLLHAKIEEMTERQKQLEEKLRDTEIKLKLKEELSEHQKIASEEKNKGLVEILKSKEIEYKETLDKLHYESQKRIDNINAENK